MQIYSKVTGKSTFRDYWVLMEQYEIRKMLKVFI
jgi:hypothetical protein